MTARKAKHARRVERLEAEGPDGAAYIVEVGWITLAEALDYMEASRGHAMARAAAGHREALAHVHSLELGVLAGAEDPTPEQIARMHALGAELERLAAEDGDSPGAAALVLRELEDEYARLVIAVEAADGERWEGTDRPPAALMRTAAEAARDFTYRSVLPPRSPNGENGSGTPSGLAEAAAESRALPAG